jgi:uncharacterized iron-regulated protein
MFHRLQRHPLTIAASLIIAGAMQIAGCAGTAWESGFGRDHPLTGRIWDVAAAEFIDRQTLISRLAGADFILLGEQHENSDHHRLQAGVLRSLLAAGRMPAVAFEMFTVDDAPAIEHHLRKAPGDAAGLGDAVNWNRRGWPDWRVYQPIAEAALSAQLPIVAADLPENLLKQISKEGLNALESRVRSKLGLDRPLPDEIHASLTADIRESHCGYVADDRLQMMLAVQRARDAHMAGSLLASGESGAVLIAGAGHARKDYGIPAYLAASAPGKRVASVGLLEVSDRKTSPRDYAPAGGTRMPPFDYVWFTPRSDDQDPCDRFREQLERLKKIEMNGVLVSAPEAA